MSEITMITEIKSRFLKDRKEIDICTEAKRSDMKLYNNGVYALCDNKKTLYVGMVSNAATANLFARIYGNGNSKHSGKTWFKKVKKCYFYTLNNGTKDDILILERILIRELKPRYNDLYFETDEIQNVLKKM